MKPSPMALAAVLAVAALAAPAATAATYHIQILLHENPFHVAPDTLRYPVGTTIVARVINVEGPPSNNSGPHDLLFEGAGVTCDREGCKTPLIPVGGEATIEVAFAEPGTVDYYCTVPGHRAGGMRGTVVVEGDATEGDNGTPGLPAAAALAVLAAAALALRRRG